MSREQWVMILSFVAGVLSLSIQALSPEPDVARLIGFAVGVINLAMSTFFGVQVYRDSKNSES